jgi:leucyl/phenylalanyl-tRNA--protein transferase
MIPWLEADVAFPPLESALREPNGLLAAGADLSPMRLVEAYRRGIFPWYSAGEPILWWSPDPRMVLIPAEFEPSRSLAKVLRNRAYSVRSDGHFGAVIDACAEPREAGGDTWIVPAMRDAYRRLHDLGIAHSFETWMEGELAGGLYGVAIGGAFFGESMFSRRSDASKIAFAHLVHHLREIGITLIDCQMNTSHLASLGANEISRREFAVRLTTLTAKAITAEKWHYRADNPGRSK